MTEVKQKGKFIFFFPLPFFGPQRNKLRALSALAALYLGPVFQAPTPGQRVPLLKRPTEWGGGSSTRGNKTEQLLHDSLNST